MCTVAAASGAASVRVRHITSRGWDPWTERPLPEVVRVAYPLSTLQPAPRDAACKTRGQDGFAILLSCRALSSPTTSRFIPAHPI